MAVILNASTSSGLVTTADNSGQIVFQSNGVTYNPTLLSGTAQASTSGTSIDFTGIPSWVKRVTVMFNGVSTTGSANLLIQLGSGSVDTTGYNCVYGLLAGATPSVSSSTNGYTASNVGTSSDTGIGSVCFALVGSNIWVGSGIVSGNTARITYSSGNKTLSGALDRVRITTSTGTDTFDAGSINILYE